MPDNKETTPQQFEDALLAREEEGRVSTEDVQSTRKRVASVPRESAGKAAEARVRKFYDEAFEEALEGIGPVKLGPKVPVYNDLSTIREYKRDTVTWGEMRPQDGMVSALEDGGTMNGGMLVVTPKKRKIKDDALIEWEPSGSALNALQIRQYPVTKRMAALLMANGLSLLHYRATDRDKGKSQSEVWYDSQAIATDVEFLMADYMTDGGFRDKVMALMQVTGLNSIEKYLAMKPPYQFLQLDKLLFHDEKPASKQEAEFRTGLYKMSLLRMISNIGQRDARESFEAFKVNMKRERENRPSNPKASR